MPLHKKGSSKAKNAKQSVDNSAKTLLANIRFLNVDDPVRTVVITSAIPNEGKTFVAANLARAMATSGVRTLLVECDMRRRSLSHTLHVHGQHGVYAVMSGEVSLLDAVVPTGTQHLHFLDAEPHIPNPSDLLNSRRFTEFVEETKKEFGYVVFDTPPVGTFVDAAVLGAKVDAVFMVVREQYTRKDEVVRAAEQLKTAKAPLSGVVMNFCERHSSEYYYDYYYREDKPKKRMEDKLPFSQPEAYEEQAVEPRSWNNAPDLFGDDQSLSAEHATEATAANDAASADGANEVRAYGRHAAVPSIGETGELSKDDLQQRS